MDSISVIIPMYNSSLTIGRALDSVLAQTYRCDYQVIVVNDGSSDDSVQVVQDYMRRHPEMRIDLIDKPNGGASSARNAGMRVARGRWIALLDSDDRWLPKKIEKQMEVLRENPQIDHLGCNVTSWTVRIFGRKKNKLSRIRLWEEFVSWYPSTPTVIFKREILDEVGYYDETMTHCEDGQFLLRILMKKQCWFMPNRLVEIGGGKPVFGHSGLSANLHAMQRGQITILEYAYRYKAINIIQYGFFKVYATLKHWRRILVTKMR